MAGDDDLERRLRKLERGRKLNLAKFNAMYQAVKDGHDLPTDDSPESELVRRLVATREAIEIVQQGIPADEWTEEYERNSFGRGFLDPSE